MVKQGRYFEPQLPNNMINTFTAIDFETAHGKRWSICQVGLIRLEEGIVQDQISILVKPPVKVYFYKNIEIQGRLPPKSNHPFFQLPQYPHHRQRIQMAIPQQILTSLFNEFGIV
jgi:hypothetical protein